MQHALFPIEDLGLILNLILKIVFLFKLTGVENYLPPALGYSTEEMLALFFETNTFHFEKEKWVLELVSNRLRGETALFDIKTPKGEILVEAGRRVTARHIRQMEEFGVTRLEVPGNYLLGKILAHDIIDPESGEILV